MAKESGVKTAQGIPAIKVLPPQITRLKKEEDDETWISSEELFTEGSSDEENCRCKSSSADASKDSSLTLSKPHRLRNRATDKRTISTPAIRAVKATSSPQSDSMEQLSAKDTDDEDDDEISWKVNRDELAMEDEIAALQRHLEEYPAICESTDKIFEDYLEKLDCMNEIEQEYYQRQNERFKEEIKSNIQFFDAVIDKLDDKLESIKRKTKLIQAQNRFKLKEMVLQGPPESKQLAKNTKGFLDLYTEKEPICLADDSSCETFKVSEKSESKFSYITMKLVKSLQVSTLTEDVSNVNSLSLTNNS